MHHYIELPSVRFDDPSKQALFDDIRRRMRLAGLRPYLRTDKGVERAGSESLGDMLFEDYADQPSYYDGAINMAIDAGLDMLADVDVVRRGRPRSRR